MLPFASITCPWCGERFETAVDPQEDHACYIEDCQVCCAPILLRVVVDRNDGSVSVDIERA